MTLLSSFIQRKVVVLHEDDSTREAARAMRDHHTSTVLVASSVDSRRSKKGPERGNHGSEQPELAGVLTDRDFAVRLVANSEFVEQSLDSPLEGTGGIDPLDEPLAKIMTADPVVANEDAPLDEVLRMMEVHGVRRIPIRLTEHRDGQKWGLVVLDDLIAGGAVTIQRLARIVRGKIRRRVSGVSNSRSGAHFQQSLQTFYHKIGQTSGLTPDLVPELSYFLLGAVFRRVSYSAAMHFIAQLPKQIQEALLELPAGPDRDITATAILDEMIFRFQFTEAHAQSVLRKFYQGFAVIAGNHVTEHLKAELPRDLRALFEEAPVQPVPPEQDFVRRSSGMHRLELRSRSFEDGKVIPRDYTAEGAGRSPSLMWSGVPEGTKGFALICEDPDAPAEQPWVHWLVYGITANTTQLPEGIPSQPEIEYPVRIRQGKNSSGLIGYQGPLPPKSHGFHRYYFKLYALNVEIALPPGAAKAELLEQIAGHVLAEGVLMGRYRREVLGRHREEVA